MAQNTFPSMTEKFSIAYSGADIEQMLRLNRPTVSGASGKWSLQWVEVYSSNAAAGASIQILSLAGSSVAAQLDVTNGSSVNVLLADWSYDAASANKRFELKNFADMSTTPFRIRLTNFGSTNHTVYINTHYYYTVA